MAEEIKNYSKSDMPEVAEKMSGEEGRVENVEKAYAMAHEVKKLVGEKIDREFNRLIAMKQFPGLEDEVAKTADNIKKLYEDAEVTMEGKKYAGTMKMAFNEVETNDISGELIGDLQSRGVEEFVKYLEVKFGPRLIRKKYRGMGTAYYLIIPDTKLGFQIVLDNPDLSQSSYTSDHFKSIRLGTLDELLRGEGGELEPL